MPDSSDSQLALRSNVFAAKAAKPPKLDDFTDSDLPDTSGPYQAFARPANKPLYTLHCWLGKEGYRSFQYVNLDSDSSFKTGPAGHVITLRFAGTQLMQVTITGRKLWRLYDYLHQHRTAFVMRADRDLADEQEAIISAIEIVPVESSDGV
jgi:hypothetical protein